MKATSLVSWKVPPISHGFHRVRGVPLVGLAVAAIVLASCNYVQWEAPSYHFNVWNYSMNQYFVVASADDGSFYTMAVGPYAVVVGSAGSPFKKASVYDENCTTDVADVVIPSGATEIVITASGSISVSTKEFVRPGASGPQIIDALPVPSGCLRYWETGTSQQP